MKEVISQKVSEAVQGLFGVEPPTFKVEKPRDESLGDLATNVAFLLAKTLKKNPMDIALSLADHLSGEEEFQGVEAVKGFINFRFSKDFLISSYREILKKGEDYFREDLGKGKKVQLEFVSANPTGPLHLGHGRGAVVGDTLARLMSFYGYEVTREYYINDAGRQVYLLGVSVLFRYLQLFGKEKERPEIEQLFEKEGYRGQYVIEIAKSLRDAVGDLILRGEIEEAHKKVLSYPYSFELNYIKDFTPNNEPDVELCAAFGLDAMMDEISEDLKDTGVEFDMWYSERDLYKRGIVDDLINTLKEKGYVYESEGAIWLKTSEFGDDKDRVIKKSDGSYTYFASDIAYHWDKFKRGFDKVVNLWGADHHGYIPRVKSALRMLDIPEEWLEVYLIQMVKLFKEGKEVKMSKRAGDFVPLRDLIRDVGADAVRFVFLTKRSDTPLDFDVDRVKEKSSENPVFYVQYAHARIAGVFRELKERKGIDPASEDLSPHLNALGEAELELIKRVLYMKDEFVEATLARDPHLIVYALIDLAGRFHRYYNHHRIIGSDRDMMLGRTALLMGIKRSLELGLKLIGVSAPERM